MTITDNEIQTIESLVAQLEDRIASLPFRPECRGRTVYDIDWNKVDRDKITFRGLKDCEPGA